MRIKKSVKDIKSEGKNLIRDIKTLHTKDFSRALEEKIIREVHSWMNDFYVHYAVHYSLLTSAIVFKMTHKSYIKLVNKYHMSLEMVLNNIQHNKRIELDKYIEDHISNQIELVNHLMS